MKGISQRFKRGLLVFFAICLSLIGSTLTSAIGFEDFVDGGNKYPWEKIEIPGTKCSNGSQYKFFIYDSPSSNNLLVMFEGGGACWDYPSCSGALDGLGTANPNGIPDSYIQSMKAQYVSPIINGADPGMPFHNKIPLVTNGWDVVYMPYCTGDVHIGDNVKIYHDPLGVNPPFSFHHKGNHNTTEAMKFLAGKFTSINKLLVTGFSAGGVASVAKYHAARTILKPQQGFMLNDSGPLYIAPNTSHHSRYLHETIKEAWDLEQVFSSMPASFDKNDYGSTTKMLATQYPEDKFAYTAFSSDYIFSRFSYERFYPGIDTAGMLQKWREDQASLVTKMNEFSNFSYHIPWHRPINGSHTSTMITFIGSHSCPSIRKKYWYEAIELPWSQTWKCPGDKIKLDQFLSRWVNSNERLRNIEPYNNYNNEDPGMSILAPIINDAI